MQHRFRLSSRVILLAAGGGGAGSAPGPAAVASAPAAGPGQQFEALYAECREENLELDPLR